MFTNKQILTFAYESEYETEYDLSQKRLFSTPKIYTANGNLNKRWYVYFSFRHPQTGNLKRLTPFYGNANQYKNKEERLEVLTVYRKTLIKLLRLGYNPFVDNTTLFQKLNNKEEKSKKVHLTDDDLQQKLEPIPQTANEIDKITIVEAFELGLKLKEKLIGKRTYKDYKNKIDLFLRWLDSTHSNILTVDNLNKNLFQQFLNHVLSNTSARNRNNYRADLGSVLQVLSDNEIIKQNFIKSIPKLKSKPERHKTFKSETEESIFKYLEDNDPTLLLFIKFYAFAFLRPLEACRLKIKDINLKDKTIQFKAKNSNVKTKILPQILLDVLPDISKLDPESLLFTPNDIGGNWDANENSRRDYFTKRFKKVVKDHFNLGIDYGLYSFRHTYITKLYRALIKDSSPFEAKSRLMLITGHTSMSALEKYLRDIDAELPQDFSEMLKRKS